MRVAGGEPERFDHVVMAVHADEVLSLLANPTREESESFSAWRYERNNAVLHTDVSMMPPDPALWASWNYRERGRRTNGSVFLKLPSQSVAGTDRCPHQYFLTLNPPTPIPVAHVRGRYHFTHPVYSADAMTGRDRMTALNGTGRVWYCGSYFGHGFHEDAVRSSQEVARRLGVEA